MKLYTHNPDTLSNIFYSSNKIIHKKTPSPDTLHMIFYSVIKLYDFSLDTSSQISYSDSIIIQTWSRYFILTIKSNLSIDTVSKIFYSDNQIVHTLSSYIV